MKLLALDPSSSAIGYSVSTGPAREHVIDAGVLRPSKKSAPAIERIRSMLVDVQALLQEHEPGAAVIEQPSQHVNKGHKGGGAGLATYGMAVGAVWGVVEVRIKEVKLVQPNTWTRGRRKTTRAVLVHLEHEIDAEADKGMDCADAIAIGQWWWERLLAEERK